AVRGVLREKRHTSPVTCCRRLRSAEVPSGRIPAGACCCSKGLCPGWDRPERRTKERIGGVAVEEQPQPLHPSDARTWVEEHVPEDSPADACRPTGQGLYDRRLTAPHNSKLTFQFQAISELTKHGSSRLQVDASE
uniref:SCAN box domain-containing protein n=1 Tax=Oryzias sinensis TaxID=183150 RepID=A0A8C7Y0H8_9TELE